LNARNAAQAPTLFYKSLARTPAAGPVRHCSDHPDPNHPHQAHSASPPPDAGRMPARPNQPPGAPRPCSISPPHTRRRRRGAGAGPPFALARAPSHALRRPHRSVAPIREAGAGALSRPPSSLRPESGAPQALCTHCHARTNAHPTPAFDQTPSAALSGSTNRRGRPLTAALPRRPAAAALFRVPRARARPGPPIGRGGVNTWRTRLDSAPASTIHT
jgi:hypothetical protein